MVQVTLRLSMMERDLPAWIYRLSTGEMEKALGHSIGSFSIEGDCSSVDELKVYHRDQGPHSYLKEEVGDVLARKIAETKGVAEEEPLEHLDCPCGESLPVLAEESSVTCPRCKQTWGVTRGGPVPPPAGGPIPPGIIQWPASFFPEKGISRACPYCQAEVVLQPGDQDKGYNRCPGCGDWLRLDAYMLVLKKVTSEERERLEAAEQSMGESEYDEEDS